MPDTDDTPLRSIDEVDGELARKMCKLMAKARSSAGTEVTQAEIENALKLAQQLAVKHRIDLASIADTDTGAAPEEELVEESFAAGKGERRPPSNKWIVAILTSFFNVEAVYSQQWIDNPHPLAGQWDPDLKIPGKRFSTGGYRPSRIRQAAVRFLGRKSDVQFALYAYWYLHKTFQKLWRKYKRTYEALMSERNSYYYGLYLGMAATLRNDRVEQEQAMLVDKEHEQRYQLAVRDEKTVRDEFLKNKHPILRKSSVSYQDNLDDAYATDRGREDGRQIRIARGLGDQKPVDIKGDLEDEDGEEDE